MENGSEFSLKQTFVGEKCVTSPRSVCVGPFLKSMGHYSNGVGQNKRNIGISISDVMFRTSIIIQYREVNIIKK